MKLLLLVISASFLAHTWAQDCSKCSRSLINFNTFNPKDSVTSNAKAEPGKNAAGCATLTVTCTSVLGDGGPGVLMTFQNDLGGPAPGKTVTTTLVCGAEGQWMFSKDGLSTAITAVHCMG